MNITCNDIAEFMEEIAPKCFAEEWDNVGQMAGSLNKPVYRVLLCLDVTPAIIDEAVEKKANLIISHHPLILQGIKRIVEEDYKGKILYKLIRNDIAVYSAHTNLDTADNGVNRKLAEKLGLNDIVNLKDTIAGMDGRKYGLGKVGLLKEPLTLKDFIYFVKTSLKVDNIKLVGNTDKMIKKVAVFCGSYDDDLDALKQHNADILVTGDVKYHTAVDALNMGYCIIDAGHFNTENIVLPALDKLISDRFPGIEVFCSQLEKDPFKTY